MEQILTVTEPSMEKTAKDRKQWGRLEEQL